ncbi:hypothetical protein QUF76_07070 [Desulfobacterales bacterium HSG16]|nr:hypothetical protein [Desulfobacterales bacterium HSG16]
MKNSLLKKLIFLFAALFIHHIVFAGMSSDEFKKRDRLRQAVKKEVLSIYDIALNTYVRLSMWDELDMIFTANERNSIQYTLPGLYYSRPHIVGDKVWIFENMTAKGSAATDRGIYVFDSKLLVPLEKKQNEKYGSLDGGIRKIIGQIVISGGANKDVDTAAVWDTVTDTFRTIHLPAGCHYIGVIEVVDNILYIGSCGGIINAWKFDSLEYIGNYASSENDGSGWEGKECISNLKISGNNVIGAGERTVFIWDRIGEKPVNTYEKIFPNSFIYFYGDYFVEFKNRKFAVRSLENGHVINKTSASNSIEDLIVTEEKLLSDVDGTLLILTLRHGMGVMIYDFDTLKPLKLLDRKGENLAVYKNAIFATDDKHLYKYRVMGKSDAKYKRFLKNIDHNKIVIDDRLYHSFIDRFRRYPKVIEKTGVADIFMKRKGLFVSHSLKYGKIGERFVYEDSREEGGSGQSMISSENGAGYREKIYGYEAGYHIINRSSNLYFITMKATWDGEFVSKSPYVSAQPSEHRFSFFIQPNNGRHMGQFDVGEREPASIVFYPVSIRETDQAYYDDFMKAWDPKNEDISLLERFLADDLVKNLHPYLEKKRAELARKQEKRSWFYRFFN